MAAKHTFARHPRYTAILVVILLAFVFVLTQGPPAPSPEGYFRRPGPKSLRWRVVDEEERYQQVLRDRQAMVRKWGPEPSMVEACVFTRAHHPPASDILAGSRRAMTSTRSVSPLSHPPLLR